MSWWQRLRRRDDLERELDAELRDHLDRQVDDYVRTGMSEEDARRRARLDFGGDDAVKEGCRDARGTRWLEDAAQDARYAVRLLAGDRWFTAAAVVALALGIGVVSLVVTVIDSYYFRGLPVPDADRIVWIGTRDFNGRNQGVSYTEYQGWRGASESLDAAAAFARATMTISDAGQSPDSQPGAYVSADAFPLLHVGPVLGRGFDASDDRPGAQPVVLLGHRLWTNRYGADPSVIGRPITVNRVAATIIGVMPEGFEFPFREALWQPLTLMPGLDTDGRDDRRLGMVGRLRPDVGLSEAQAELAAMMVPAADRAHQETDERVEPVVLRFGEQQVGRLADAQPPLALAATAVLVLLIACANVANLLFARAAGRAREMAIRTSVGATRSRVVRQLLVESLMLGFAAGATGVWLSLFGVHFVSAAFGQNVPYWMHLSVDARVLAMVAAACVAASLLSGLAPALVVSKTDVNGLMKEGGRAGLAPRMRPLTGLLLAGQIALTLVVMTGAGLLVRSYLALYRVDQVIDPTNVLTLQVALPEATYDTPEKRVGFVTRLDQRLGELAGLPVAAVASARPFTGAPSRGLAFDRTDGGATQLPPVSVVAIGPAYFEALRLRLIRGRAFTARDGAPGQETAIVNQRFAETHFTGREILGERVRLVAEGADSAPWLTIVGVSPTVRQSIASEGRPVVYVPLRTHTGAGASIIVGGRSDPSPATSQIRQEVAALDPDVIVYSVRPLADLLADSRLQPRLVGTGLAAFAAIAWLLSIIGLYAATAYAVVQRTHEIGVRMALGARPRQVAGLFVRRGLAALGAGLAFGLAGAFAGGQLLRGLLIRTSATDTVTLLVAVVLVVGVGLAACLVPARRAARQDPLSVLRYD